MKRFTSIHIEVNISDTWIPLEDDVLSSPAPRVQGMGITNFDVLSRTGGPAVFTFSLNNSETNSQDTLGYYSPGHASALSGWTTGLPVRLYFLYDGIYKHAFYGKIDPDGIRVMPGTKKRRVVEVTASNWMREAAAHTVNLLQYVTYSTANAGIAAIVANLTNQPLATSYQQGVQGLPALFDVTSQKTKAMSEINKLTVSEMGLSYMRGVYSMTDDPAGETLVFEKRTHRYEQRETPTQIALHSSEPLSYLLLETGDFLLQENGDKIYLEASQAAVFDETDIIDMDVSYGAHIYNRVRLTTYPRRLDDSPVVLWQLEEPFELAVGATHNMRVSYRDPNGKSSSVSGINMITPVSGTDYAAFQYPTGTGTDYTADLSVTVEYGTSEAEYTLENTGASSFYVTTLQARGYGVYVYDSTTTVKESASSIAAYGESEVNIDLPYVRNLRSLGIDADELIGKWVHDTPEYYIERASFMANKDDFNMMAFMCLNAGDFIKLSETMTGIDTTYTWCIHAYDLEIRDGWIAVWHPMLMLSTQYPQE